MENQRILLTTFPEYVLVNKRILAVNYSVMKIALYFVSDYLRADKEKIKEDILKEAETSVDFFSVEEIDSFVEGFVDNFNSIAKVKYRLKSPSN